MLDMLTTLKAVDATLAENGGVGYVVVTDRTDLTEGAIVSLQSTAPLFRGNLKIHRLEANKVYLWDKVAHAPFNASAYLTANGAVLHQPVQDIYGGLNREFFRDPDDNETFLSSEEIKSILSSLFPSVQVNFPTDQLSAFGQFMMAEPTSEVSLEFNYSVNPDFVNTVVANGGEVTQENSMIELHCGTNAAGSALMESKAALRYTAGEGIYASFTARFTLGTDNSQQEIGLGDVADGYFFGYQGATFGVFRRSGGVDTFVPQSSWNGDDKFDGTGPSGATVDPTKLNVYKVSIAWHGGGPIRYYIFSPVTGRPTLAHTTAYTNSTTVPSVLNPTLPLHARCFNSGSTVDKHIWTASMGAYVEGHRATEGSPGSTGNLKNVTTEVSLFTIRNDPTFQSKTNRVRVAVKHFSGSSLGGADMLFRLVKNATLGGTPAYTSVNTNSVVSRDIAGTTVTGGVEVFRVRVDSNLGETLPLEHLQITLNPGDTLTAACTSGAGATNADASLQWTALFTG